MPNYVTNNLEIKADGARLDEILDAIRFEDGPKGSLDFNRLIPMPQSLDMTQGTITRASMEAYISHIHSNQIPDCNVPLYDYAFQHFKRFFPFSKPAIPSEKEIPDIAERHNMSVDAFLTLGKQYLDNILEHGSPTWYDWRIQNWGTKWDLSPDDCILSRENLLCFDTAWSAPDPIIQKISQMFPDIEFQHEWADEDLGRNVGRTTYCNGVILHQFIPEAYSKAGYDLAFQIHDITPEDRCLVYDEKEKTYIFSEELERQQEEAFKEAAGKALSERLEHAQNMVNGQHEPSNKTSEIEPSR